MKEEDLVDKKPRRYYSTATIAALTTLARGGCYWPGCNIPTVRLINGAPKFNLEIAHIAAFDEGGKRFDETRSVKERNSFDNLILLCNPHHEEVDGPNSDDYPPETLLKWKNAREADGMDALAGLGDLTKNDLGEMIAAAQAELMDRIGPALDELAKTAPEVADLLRAVMKELADPRIHGFGLSEDMVSSLHSSARVFANLEDSAMVLADAARTLVNLEDSASTLADAAVSLAALEDNANALSNAAQKTLVAVSHLESLPDHARVLSQAASKAMTAADMLSNRRY